MRSSGQLRMAPDGTPLRYDWTAQTQKKVTGFVENPTARYFFYPVDITS
jgi:hypothetical protein